MEITDGDTFGYRGNYLYDLVKALDVEDEYEMRGRIDQNRLILAFIGGSIMGFGARLARGCASGMALTGGATLALGSWAFMLMMFAGGYMMAYFVKRQWI